ncbi:MAG: hypothetical protein ABIB93_00545 [Chloroflexota bacterium]
MTLTDWIQAVSMVVLVGVTIVYVLLTRSISKAAKEQAEEMREQRLSEARPYLLLRLDLNKNELLQWEECQGNSYPTEFMIAIHNAGSGPAINLEAALWHREETRFAVDRKGYLAPNEEWQATISRIDTRIKLKEGWLPQLASIVKQNKAGIIAVEYKDMHKRSWVTYLYLERNPDIEECVTEGEQNIVEVKHND